MDQPLLARLRGAVPIIGARAAIAGRGEVSVSLFDDAKLARLVGRMSRNPRGGERMGSRELDHRRRLQGHACTRHRLARMSPRCRGTPSRSRLANFPVTLYRSSLGPKSASQPAATRAKRLTPCRRHRGVSRSSSRLTHAHLRAGSTRTFADLDVSDIFGSRTQFNAAPGGGGGHAGLA